MAGNVSENNVIVLLSDSEDDANMETDVRVGDAETMIKPLASSSSAGTVEANSKNSDNSDSSVILLDESWEDSEAEMPNNEDSSKDQFVGTIHENLSNLCQKRSCINYDCKSNKKTISFSKAPMWALNHFNVPCNVNRVQFICQTCFDVSVNDYERMCEALVNQQPLLLEQLPIRPEVVKLIDSEDEEDMSTNEYNECSKPLSFDTLTFLDNHFEDAVKEAFESIDIEKQMAWTNQILNHKVEKNDAISCDLDMEIVKLQQLSDSMYEELYKHTNYVLEELPPFDLNENKQLHIYGPNYPPHGEVVYPMVNMNSLYYAVRTNLLATWLPCKITERTDAASVDGRSQFNVRFLRTKGVLNKIVRANHLAYGTAPNVRLSVGTRVIAFSKKNHTKNLLSTFFPGIIAEPLQAYNKWRYLIFFDDGCVQYVTPDNIRLICSPSPNVWEDVHPASAEFIKSYLEQYKRLRPMVDVKRGQRMITEWNSAWTYARVQDIDSSLVLMQFEHSKRSEWIYRGSMRLGPLFKDHQLQKHSVFPVKRPFVEYVDVEDGGKRINTGSSQAHEHPVTKSPIDITLPSQVIPRNVEEQCSDERKCVTVPSSLPQPTVHMNRATIYIEEDNRPKGRVIYFAPKNAIPPKKLVRHNCGVGCLFEMKHNLRAYNPLAKPLLCGWERNNVRKKTKTIVVYRTPCGRTIKTMPELHKYLRVTKCSLNVDNFDFDIMVHCLAEFVVDRCFVKKRDLSDGCEAMVVSLVNYYDDTMPPPCVYSTKRIPNEGVNLNLDNEFLCGCDCIDDCSDKSKCQCWKLTLEGARFTDPDIPIEQVGYKFKRLENQLQTGIYECNSRCKCSKMCLNRVAQHPLQLKLQVFKTESRGWGLRCLNDIPKGGFICVYAGDLLTDGNANIFGREYGDEYLAELDYIEHNEKLKEGYEAGVIDYDDELDPNQTRNDSDVDAGRTDCDTRNFVDASDDKKNTEPSGSDSDEEGTAQQLISFVPNASSWSQYKSIHRFYDKNERVFAMDAKKRGNIGRYFNHSCSPNIFIQNVFVDTHDLRFPWIAFFALSYIPAGTELTWNYNYDVGSVPGKVLYCECGSENCRGRIL